MQLLKQRYQYIPRYGIAVKVPDVQDIHIPIQIPALETCPEQTGQNAS
jgi:hypothetical protein